MIDKDHAEIVIAALLHDLGKVTQRAGAEECLTPGMDGQLLPLSKDKRYTHKHAWYTHGAILLIKDSLPPSCNVERIARLAAAHHNPGSWEEWIIAEADRISSGADRTDRELDAELKGTYIEQPNLSIFSAVKLGKPATSPSMFHKLGPQTVPGSIPVEFFKNDRNGYKAIWEGLRGDFAKIKVADIEDWLAVADSILEHWTWAVPSTTIDQPDISLYDHLRTTTAFASALYQFHLSNGSRDDLRQLKDADIRKILLLTGDFSGIQRYLFDIKTSAGSAKTLRARSFELVALSLSAARTIQNSFGVTRFAQAANAGGRFILILPNLGNSASLLAKVRTGIDEEMIHRHFGMVSVVISSGVAVNKLELQQERFIETFNRMGKDIADSKQRKLQSGLIHTGQVLDDDYNRVRVALQSGGSICPVCDLRAGEYFNEPCLQCQSLIDIGTLLPKVDRMAIMSGAHPRNSLPLLGDEYLQFLQSGDKAISGSSIATVNKYQAGMEFFRLPYTVPRTELGEVKEFGEIAQKARGVKHLAMLKADIDNLGAVFSFGLGAQLSISRYATLSRCLDFFFSQTVRETIENNPSFSDIYTVYSGGDDLCVIGPWNVIIDFSIQIRKALGAYTGNNGQIGISAGIALAGKGIPVARIADEAEQEMEFAKDKPGKDSICMLGIPMGWAEFEQQIADGLFLADELEARSTATATVYSIIENSRKAESFTKGIISRENALWKSHFEYMVKRTRAPAKTIALLKQYSVNTDSMIKARIAASCALYMNRNGGKDR